MVRDVHGTHMPARNNSVGCVLVGSQRAYRTDDNLFAAHHSTYYPGFLYGIRNWYIHVVPHKHR